MRSPFQHLAVFLVIAVLAGVSLMCAIPAGAQVGSGDPGAVTSTEPSEPPAPDPVVAPATVTVDDMVVDTKEVLEALKVYREKRQESGHTSTILSIMALLAFVFKGLLSLLKWTSTFWTTPKGKILVQLATVTLAVLVFFASTMAAGENWLNATILCLSGPLAVAVHEYSALVPKLRKKAKDSPGVANG